MAFGRPRNKSLSSVDVAWYQMEDPTNLMMITGLMFFDEPVDFDRLSHVLETRLVGQYRRFRQRVVERASRFGRPYWQDDPNFDINSHLHRIGVPAPGDHAALQNLASDLMSMPLDFTKPLWQFHLVEGYQGRSVLLVRLHHCIADGIALMQVVLSLTDTTRDAPLDLPIPPRRKSGGWNPLAPVTRPAKKAVKLSTRAVSATVGNTMRVVRNPEHLVDMARTGTDLALTTGRLLLMAPDPKNSLQRQVGRRQTGSVVRTRPAGRSQADRSSYGRYGQRCAHERRSRRDAPLPHRPRHPGGRSGRSLYYSGQPAPSHRGVDSG